MPVWWLQLKFLQPGFPSAESLRQSWELPWKNRLCWGGKVTDMLYAHFTNGAQEVGGPSSCSSISWAAFFSCPNFRQEHWIRPAGIEKGLSFPFDGFSIFIEDYTCTIFILVFWPIRVITDSMLIRSWDPSFSVFKIVVGLIEVTPDGVFMVLKIFRIEKFWHTRILFCYHFEKNCSLLTTRETESAKNSVTILVRLLWLMESTAVPKQWQKITEKNALLTRPGGHFFQGVPAVVPFKVWKEEFHRGLQDVFLLFNRLLNLRIGKAEGLEH